MAKSQSLAEEIRFQICGAESVLFVGCQWQRNIPRRLFRAPAASTYGRVKSQPQLNSYRDCQLPCHETRKVLPSKRGVNQDSLTLWKDADPDIPILKQAKAEYAKLQ